MLPTELLTDIAEYLDDTSSFNLASKRCYHAALPVRYRQVTLPRESFDKYIPLLAGRASYIRAVNVVTELQYRHERLLGLVVEPYIAQRANYPKERPYLGLLRFLEATQVHDLYWSSDDAVPVRIVHLMEGRRLHLMHFRPAAVAPCVRSISMAFSRRERMIPLLRKVVSRDLDQLCLSGSEPPWEMGVPQGSVKRLYIDPRDGGQHHRTSTVYWRVGTLRVLETWFDFGVLRVLHLEQVNHADGEWLCRAQLSLVALKLGRYLDTLPRPPYLDCIQGVTQLTLMEVDLETLGRLLKRLRLTRLGVPNTVVTGEWLARNTQYLKVVELSVGVQRTDDVYESLSRLPLERLHLRYISSWWELLREKPDISRFHILRELAMDDELAQAVYKAVGVPELTLEAHWPVIMYARESNDDGQGGYSVPPGGLFTPDIIRLLEHVAKPFVCTGDGCVVKSSWRPWGHNIDEIARGPRLGRAVKALWPGIEQGEFKDVWHSFPIGDRTEPPWSERGRHRSRSVVQRVGLPESRYMTVEEDE